MAVCLSVCMFVCLFGCLFDCLIVPFVRSFVCWFVRLVVCTYVHVCACIHVHIYILNVGVLLFEFIKRSLAALSYPWHLMPGSRWAPC